MGATICDGAVVEGYSLVAAGAVVPSGVVVKSGEIWAGNAAKFLRKVTTEEREAINEHLAEMRALAEIHSEETAKTLD
jgi:carbonic anhydrase/acetyltransferase-like protein (isoleucine patch superfamily)